MGRKVETVMVRHPGDPSVPLRMNKADFRPGTHQLWQSPPEPEIKLLSPVEAVQPEPEIKLFDPVEVVQIEAKTRDWHLLMSTSGWREVKAAAEVIGYNKPDGLSWEDAIPELIAYEQEVLSSAQN